VQVFILSEEEILVHILVMVIYVITSLKLTIMKRYVITPVMVLLFSAFTTLLAQNRQEEYLGLPGDNLNLFAVMKLFQESETLEGFERSLNAEDSRINNLDLDGDGFVDYIRVVDNVDRNVHYIVLQDAISSRENQDVAVFTVMREADGEVQLQLIGDEALYGRDYIVEPIYDETPNPGYIGSSRKYADQRVVVTRTTTYEIAAWPLVRFIFLPTYVVWHSPWYYSYYPTYWRPWSPFYWHYYSGYHYNDYNYYYGHYRHWDHYRNPYWRDSYYSSRRSYSPVVHSRIQGGNYKTTYSHPEQRREGASMYRRTNPDQNTQSTGRTSGSSTMRRSSSENGTGRQSTSTGTTGRSTSTGTTSRSTSTGTNNQSTTSGVSNSGRRSSAGQNATQNPATGKSTSTGASTSGRRSSGNNKTATTGQQTERTKETKTTSGSGRR